MAATMGHTVKGGGQGGGGSVHHHFPSVSVMTETAKRFLAALSPDQRAKATFPFSDEERFNWHYIPKERKGLTLGEMSPYPEAPGERAAGGRTEPDRLHQGRHHHEPGRRAASAGER